MLEISLEFLEFGDGIREEFVEALLLKNSVAILLKIE